jgi:hypothetical protein
LLDDRSCPSNNPPYGWQSLYVCYAGSWSPNSDFGGYYHHDGTTCNVGNPYAAGACSCPSGAQAIEFIVDGSCWNDWRIGLCWNPSAPATTFAGAYETSDSTTYGNNGCVVANPATGACTCPAGSTGIAVRSVYGPGSSNCHNTGAIGGHVYLCRAN